MTDFEWFIMGTINGVFGCLLVILLCLWRKKHRQDHAFEKWLEAKKEWNKFELRWRDEVQEICNNAEE